MFDSMGRYSIAEDDEAKWLTGERQSTSKGPQPRETAQPGDRRLSAVPDAATLPDRRRGPDQSDDLLSLAEDSDDLTAVVRAVNRAATAADAADHAPVDADVHVEEPTEELADAPVEAERGHRA